MPEFEFRTAVWLSAGICGLFALAGGLLAPSLGSNPFARRLMLANATMCACLTIRVLAAASVSNLVYAVVWTLWSGATLTFISALRLISDQSPRDRGLAAQWGTFAVLLFATAALTPVAQVIALVASGCLLWAMGLCVLNAWRIPNPKLRRIRLWLVASFGIGTLVVAAHVPLRVTELLAGQKTMAHSGATYVFLLMLWVASNVGLMLLVQSKLALRVAALAHNDELTRLLNRRGLFEQLAEDSLSGGAARPSVLTLLDLDHFKSINDRHGHENGDVVLRWFADRLRAHAGAGDCLVRFGGEEFVWVMRGSTLREGAERAERLRAELSEQLPCELTQPPLRVTVSIGLTEFSGRLDDFKRSLARADEALYTAKRAGRDAVRCWNRAEVPAIVPIAGQRREDAALV